MQPVNVPYGTVAVSFKPFTRAWSATTPGAFSWRYVSPIWGWASMMTPACAPFFPASHEPTVLTGGPSSFVSSPKYQTFPSLSGAYQSKVSSLRAPFRYTASWTTNVATLRIGLVSYVTVTASISTPSGVSCRYGKTVPGTRG